MPPALCRLINLNMVRELVREKLGCGCPDDVFESVIVGIPSIFEEQSPPIFAEILVGRKLLLALVERGSLSDLEKDIESILLNGRKRRDRHGLHRFRLVIVGECDKTAFAEVSRTEARIDERIHVHLLDSLPEVGDIGSK